ncbi:MAG TPA: protein TolR [Gammaproteobacteria bacterium]|nr:protein TolR [Gammaproteobacteria bacterium]
MRRRARINKPIAEINVVPYIDVMLVLLIIFMVTAPMLVRNVDVELPVSQGDPGSVAEEQPPIVLGVTNNGLYFLYNDDGEREFLPSEDAALAATLALTISDPSRDVMVYGDKKVEYGNVLRLLQAVQQSVEKGKRVKLMTIISDGSG